MSRFHCVRAAEIQASPGTVRHECPSSKQRASSRALHLEGADVDLIAGITRLDPIVLHQTASKSTP
jgi:hypothetical protein